MPVSFTCLGGAVIDRKLIAPEPFRLGSSNPVRERVSHGGVARNVAETLARLGQTVRFVSCVGDDAGGQGLCAHLAALGVDIAGVRRVGGAATASYTALIGPDGALLVAAAEMAVLDQVYGSVVEAAVAGLGQGDLLFADCNAPADTLAGLAARARASGLRLALDAISTVKARRLPADLSGVACLFLNHDEAAAALDAPAIAPSEAVAALRARGAERVVLTVGADGALACERERLVMIPSVATAIVDVTGAGDALIAGALTGLAKGAALADAVAFGATLAARVLARLDSVDPTLSPALVAEAFPAQALKDRP
jgi:pseudouridine kinase